METRHLRQQIVAMRQSFFDEEILDEQFCQLEQLEENGNPSFLEQVFTMYFNDSTTVLATVEQAMREIESIDLGEVDHVLHKFKGSSASVGANKVRNQIVNTRKFVAEGDLKGAEVAFQELRKEYDNLKAKLEHYFQQLKRAGPAAAGDCSASQVK
ncbi:HPT phosphotransmitter 4 [Hibiscus trionum]|uniref:Histidine-containing phosphotransfer protein n=1 Tax=Hibiscus trionum TaxID=183268 RepID=A0A9W7HAI8_HIBTR|nr:HPT phosphotransmitter 4 [Hibiscus trionum]